MDPPAAERLRWTLADREPPTLFGAEGERIRHPEFADMEFLHVRAKRIINEVPAKSRMPFRFTINAYRGCSHACGFCFARPTHEYLNLNAGRDFERVIVVKVNAVEALRAELRSPSWGGDHIAMGTNTDPYQRCEGRYQLTRGIIEVLAEAQNPFSILTKSSLIMRDLDLLSDAATRIDVAVNFSVGTLDEAVWRASEPGTPHPMRRIEACAALNEAGVPSGILVAPILPGLSDRPEQLEAVVKAAVAAKATVIAPILLHLRPGVREQYMPWLEETRPDLVELYEELYPRAYAPRKEQDAVRDLVRDLVRRHGGYPVSPRRARGVPEPESRTPAAPLPDPPASEQLSLGM